MPVGKGGPKHPLLVFVEGEAAFEQACAGELLERGAGSLAHSWQIGRV
jgi:hypothetical protein